MSVASTVLASNRAREVRTLDYRILGPLEVVDADRRLPLGGPKQRSLLAVLLLHANEVVSADSLIDRLWGGEPPPTASKVLQVQVWRLRKALGRDALITRPPGYMLQVGPEEVDLARFERLVGEAQSGAPDAAAAKLREALGLWRGVPLADLAHEDFVTAEVARLEELRVVALEQRVEADLALGRHGELVPELEALVAEHPYRESLHGQLMLALYRSGRQADALERFQALRGLLDEELGLEPGEQLKQLQKAILAHDPSLDAPVRRPVARRETVLVAVDGSAALEPLLTLARPLAKSDHGRELVIAQVVEAGDLAPATASLGERAAQLASEGVNARAAAFSSDAFGLDVARLASRHEADLVVAALGAASLDGETRRLLETAPCDVALLGAAGGAEPGPILVPFGAAEHDWAALELGAWLARSTGQPLRLVGAAADARGDGRDASRLLADASLIVQRTAGVPAEPLLASPGRESLAELAEGAGLLVVGLSDRWRTEGLGRIRSELAASPPAPTVFIRRGIRPGGIAPVESRTRFTWSLTHAGAAA
jgi:DNA-binding SARP family transcriptional activator